MLPTDPSYIYGSSGVIQHPSTMKNVCNHSQVQVGTQTPQQANVPKIFQSPLRLVSSSHYTILIDIHIHNHHRACYTKHLINHFVNSTRGTIRISISLIRHSKFSALTNNHITAHFADNVPNSSQQPSQQQQPLQQQQQQQKLQQVPPPQQLQSSQQPQKFFQAQVSGLVYSILLKSLNIAQ